MKVERTFGLRKGAEANRDLLSATMEAFIFNIRRPNSTAERVAGRTDRLPG